MRLVNARIVGFVGALALVAGCASGGWKSESSTAPDTDLAAYASFGWLTEAATEAPLSVADAKLRKAIHDQLVAKGYREDQTNPDLRIGFATESHPREKSTPPMRVGVGMGNWTGPIGTSVGTSVPVGKEKVTTVSETRLTIRAVDPNGDRELWVGSASGEVSEGSDESTLDKAVAAALDGLPARSR